MRSLLGAILSGGEARRAGGRCKGHFPHPCGGTFLTRLIQEMAEAGLADCILLANEAASYQDLAVEIVADLRPGHGPLGGIEAGLSYAARRGTWDGVLFLPCDLPELTGQAILRLADAFRYGSNPVSIARIIAVPPRVQPHCCVAALSELGAVSAALDRGERKLSRFWESRQLDTVDYESSNFFINVNSIEGYNAWIGSSAKEEAI